MADDEPNFLPESRREDEQKVAFYWMGSEGPFWPGLVGGTMHMANGQWVAIVPSIGTTPLPVIVPKDSAEKLDLAPVYLVGGEVEYSDANVPIGFTLKVVRFPPPAGPQLIV